MVTIESMRDLNLISTMFRIVLAILVGGVIGIERGRKNRPAGLRTYILVCLGSALVMMTNQFVYIEFGVSDPVRLGAQVISGIGFLGAGTIVLNGKSQIKGLTTAASLWTAACIGLAIGIGYYEGAILGGFAIVFTVSGLHRFDNWMHKRTSYLELYIEYNEWENTFGDFLQYVRAHDFEISDIRISKDEGYTREDKKQNVVSYLLTVKSTTKRSHEEMIKTLMGADGIRFIEEL